MKVLHFGILSCMTVFVECLFHVYFILIEVMDDMLMMWNGTIYFQPILGSPTESVTWYASFSSLVRRKDFTSTVMHLPDFLEPLLLGAKKVETTSILYYNDTTSKSDMSTTIKVYGVASNAFRNTRIYILMYRTWVFIKNNNFSLKVISTKKKLYIIIFLFYCLNLCWKI